MLIKYVYTFFLALLLVLFVGVGISVFYPEPQRPDYPERLARPLPENGDLSEKELAKSRKADREFKVEQDNFEKRSGAYNRNVSIISLVISILVLVVTLTIFKRVPVISDGLLLGGVFILGYSIIRGFAGNDDRFRFFVITAGLIMTLVLGYLKFIKDEKQADKPV